ncbi:Calcium-transporting ATPase 10, plasma membrane-type [Clydaea vesicula]|uniref:Calcium-transporting ATPase n=1 Tax=Clydaea vesicula TaxID=447962 RepID=A0AAD5U2A6_9FUNG|nr:Calcium-transporting ATPase 10, plasma membrane-type [Clydaea vesicula]
MTFMNKEKTISLDINEEKYISIDSASNNEGDENSKFFIQSLTEQLETFVEQPKYLEEKLKFKAPFLLNDEFGITLAELIGLISFENRFEKNQLSNLNSERFGGVEGIAYLLRSNLKAGLALNQSKNKWNSEISLQKLKQSRKCKNVSIFKKAYRRLLSKKETESNDELNALKGDVSDGFIRSETFGRNLIKIQKSKSLFRLLIESIRDDAILKVLIIGSVIALIVGEIEDPVNGWWDSFAILIAVFIVSSVNAVNNYTTDKKFKSLLMLQSAIKTKVIRDGRMDEISSWDLLVGDVVTLSLGDEIPGDGLYIRGENLMIDESPLTGENQAVRKSAEQVFLFSGCHVSEGSGFMLITSMNYFLYYLYLPNLGVGVNSTSGRIQQLLSERQKQLTPLQIRLEFLAKQIGIIGFVSAILTFVALIINWGVKFHYRSTMENAVIVVGEEISTILHFLIASVTILVVAIPEGLPISVTISLGFSMFEMMKDNCFVRQLHSSETMGAATCICLDKTGTLTENRMTVVKAVFGDRIYNGERSETGKNNEKEFHSKTVSDELNDLITENISSNSSCFLKREEGKKHATFVGSATEGSLLVFIEKLGNSYQDVRNNITRAENGVWQFDSNRKMMSTLIFPCIKPPTIDPGCEYKYTLHVKGASEIVLSLSTHFVDRSGTRVCEMSESDRARFLDIIKSWAAGGWRTLALAYRATNVHPNDELERHIRPEHDLILIGLIGIKDPVRKDVAKAVSECNRAGLSIRMVTGDNLLTASKIAQECGILKPGGIAIEGKRFRNLSREDKIKLLPHLQVIARSTPMDKFDLVTLLKECGEVVAVTGDGTNDAPALKAADVGFSMGLSGTQVAINASDIVLMDDNFISLVAAIKWGRNVLNSVRKFLQFQLSINLIVIVTTLFSSAVVGEPIINSASLLWVNLIMDSLGALALASEKPDDRILKQRPHKRFSKMLTENMKFYISIQTFFQASIIISAKFNLSSYVPILNKQVIDNGDSELYELELKKHVSTILVTTFTTKQ